jgi:nicotinamidase-related amidase
MDLQNGIVARLADQGEGLLVILERVIAVARERTMPVIFVRVAFRPGSPEVSARNQSFSALRAEARMDETSDGTKIHPRLAPHEGDVVVTKRRVSAFTGSDLEVVLRSLEVDHLVLTGVSTSGVVLSTTRQAADLDYRITVLADACADPDVEVHRVLTEKVFPRQAAVVSSGDWIANP